MPMSFVETMEKKYKELYEALEGKDAEELLIHHPQVLGDNYEELVYNLNKLSDSGKLLRIIPTKER